MRKLMMTAAFVLAAGSALAQPAPGGAMMGGANQMTQEERAMQFLDREAATKGMTADQIAAYRADQRTKQQAMSDADRAKQKADLDTRWAKLSKADQDKAMAGMQASFQGGGGRQGGGAPGAAP